jgi:hypothetical protein
MGFKRAGSGWTAAVVLACLAAGTAAIPWAVAQRPMTLATASATAVSTPGRPVEAVARAPATKAHRADQPASRPSVLVEEPGKTRGKAVCAECGIIEAVQRVDTPLQFTGWCDATEIARAQNTGKAYGRGFRADRESLRETVAAAIAASRPRRRTW